MSGTDPRRRRRARRRTTVLVALAAALAAEPAPAHSGARSGPQVVALACANCHASGKDGAPRIGDKAAWSKRAELGLSALTQEALTGIRRMPAHGGSLRPLRLREGLQCLRPSLGMSSAPPS